MSRLSGSMRTAPRGSTTGLTAKLQTGGNGARGVKIDFVGDDGRPQTLYYFSVNVDNDGFRASGFAAFLRTPRHWRRIRQERVISDVSRPFFRRS